MIPGSVAPSSGNTFSPPREPGSQASAGSMQLGLSTPGWLPMGQGAGGRHPDTRFLETSLGPSNLRQTLELPHSLRGFWQDPGTSRAIPTPRDQLQPSIALLEKAPSSSSSGWWHLHYCHQAAPLKSSWHPSLLTAQRGGVCPPSAICP